MCEIMTIITAVIFTIVHALQKKGGKKSKPVLFAAFMFWGAALMWAVDGIASVLEGEGFFDISVDDTILGLIIVSSGLLLFAVSILLQKKTAGRRMYAKSVS